MQSFFILRFLSGRDSVQSHRPIPGRHRSHLFGKLETFSTITLHGAGCFVSKAMARICISAKSIFPPVVEKMLMVAGASPALVSSLLIHGDQFRVVRCLAFGLPVPHSPRSGQFCVLLCNPVTVPVRLRCALLRVHHQVSGQGWLPAFTSLPFTTSGYCACPIHAAADLMAPSSRQGQFKTETPHAMFRFCHHCEWPEILPAPVWRLCF